MDKHITKAEEAVMQQLWKLGQSFLRELVDSFEGKKPHQNTIATLLKNLESKNFIRIESVGRNHLYIPIVSKEDYSKSTVNGLVKKYFKGSFSQMVSFFAREKSITVDELEAILKEIKK